MSALGLKDLSKFFELSSVAESQDDVADLEESAGIVEERIPRIKDTKFVLTDLILREWFTYGFLSVITYGRQGVGKSIYNMKVAAEVFGYLKRKLTWRELIDKYVVFDVDDLISRVREARSRIPVLIWDDAGVHGSSYWWFLDRKRTMLLSALFQTARTKLNALLMNSPNPAFILKHFRVIDSIIVLVVKADGRRSVAHGYRLKLLPSGRIVIKKLFMDTFIREFKGYEHYLEKRKAYVDYVLDEIRKAAGNVLDKEEKIAEMLKQGRTYAEIAAALNVSYSTISKVKKSMEGGSHGVE